MGSFLAPRLLEEVALAGISKPYTRYNVNTSQGQAMLSKLANAIQIMKSSAYPSCDPHSYTFQEFTHWTQQYQAFQYQQSTQYKEQYIQTYCTGLDATLAEAMWNGCQAHGIDNSNPTHFQEWFFPAWHRVYLYYFEQIVRNVLGDSSFSLPYWNPASGNVADLSIPAAFRDSSSPLYDDTRYSLINQGVRIDNVVLAPNWLTVNCLNEPRYITSATSGIGFCPAADINPHFLVHIGIGGDMSDGFNVVVKDPIFWVHHANIDRLWESWNRLFLHTNPLDSQWRTRTFTWADGTGKPVNVAVSDAQRISQLGYQYDNYSRPPSPILGSSTQQAEPGRQMPQVMVAAATGGPILAPDAAVLPLPAVVTDGKQTTIPLTRRVEELAPGRQIYLVFKGLRAEPVSSSAFGIYFDLPKGAVPADGSDPHFVAALPMLSGHAHGKEMAFNVTDTLLRLNANKLLRDRENTVSIVPNRTSADVKAEMNSRAAAAKRVGSSGGIICRSSTGSGAFDGATVEQVALIEQ